MGVVPINNGAISLFLETYSLPRLREERPTEPATLSSTSHTWILTLPRGRAQRADDKSAENEGIRPCLHSAVPVDVDVSETRHQVTSHSPAAQVADKERELGGAGSIKSWRAVLPLETMGAEQRSASKSRRHLYPRTLKGVRHVMTTAARSPALPTFSRIPLLVASNGNSRTSYQKYRAPDFLQAYEKHTTRVQPVGRRTGAFLRSLLTYHVTRRELCTLVQNLARDSVVFIAPRILALKRENIYRMAGVLSIVVRNLHVTDDKPNQPIKKNCTGKRDWGRNGSWPLLGTAPPFAWSDSGKPRKTEVRIPGPEIEPGSSRMRVHWFNFSNVETRTNFRVPRGRGGVMARLLASHLGEPGSIPGGAAPVLSHVIIVADDAASRQAFSGVNNFPPPLHSGAASFTPRFTLIGSQYLGVKSHPNLFNHSMSQLWTDILPIASPTLFKPRRPPSQESFWRVESLEECAALSETAQRSGGPAVCRVTTNVTRWSEVCLLRERGGRERERERQRQRQRLAGGAIKLDAEEIWAALNIQVLRTGTGEASGIVRHDSHMRKSGDDPAGNRTRFALVEGEQSNHYTTAAPSNIRDTIFLRVNIFLRRKEIMVSKLKAARFCRWKLSRKHGRPRNGENKEIYANILIKKEPLQSGKIWVSKNNQFASCCQQEQAACFMLSAITTRLLHAISKYNQLASCSQQEQPACLVLSARTTRLLRAVSKNNQFALCCQQEQAACFMLSAITTRLLRAINKYNKLASCSQQEQPACLVLSARTTRLIRAVSKNNQLISLLRAVRKNNQIASCCQQEQPACFVLSVRTTTLLRAVSKNNQLASCYQLEQPDCFVLSVRTSSLLRAVSKNN
ncbi:hypothetical protein PR048_010083 [Dryococelus australis]|uniref:Uncharacterized protein n=1 Tax=Dryococelus australis TaxID=614101 RepID=A0ABQ9I2P8_9NEOP|nr:hypothetical protein PR048_010083 [Dryococelus australis]